MSRWIAAGVVAFLCILTVFLLSGEALVVLLFGWIKFLFRVLPQMHVRGDGLLIFLGAFIALVAISHYLLRWLYREIQTETESPKPWRIRSTAALGGLVLLFFTAGIALVGIVHQTYWLAADDEPLHEEGFAPFPRNSNLKWNAKSVGYAIASHSDAHGSLPTQWDYGGERARHSWVTPLLVYMSYSPGVLKSGINMEQEWDSPHNAPWFKDFVPELLNSELRTPPLRDANGFALNHYAGNSLILGHRNKLKPEDIAGKHSNTFLIGQVNNQFIAWGHPVNYRDPRHGINTPNGFGSGPNSGGPLFLMVDGSVKRINENIDTEVLNAMSTPEAD